MKVIGSRSSSQEQEVQNSRFPSPIQRKTTTACNLVAYTQARTVENGPENVFRRHLHSVFGAKGFFKYFLLFIAKNAKFSIPDRAAKFVCSLSFSPAADQMVWSSSLCRDQNWLRLSKCTHCGWSVFRRHFL